MPIAFAKLRVSWIALAACVGASLVKSDASAACTSMPDAGGYRPACCRKASKSATPIRAVVSATVSRHFPSDNGSVCPDAAGCHCCPPAPTAPEPKQRRGWESRPDPGRNLEAGWLDIDGVFRPLIGPIPPHHQPAAEIPPLSAQFPASDLKLPRIEVSDPRAFGVRVAGTRRVPSAGLRSSCVRRPCLGPFRAWASPRTGFRAS